MKGRLAAAGGLTLALVGGAALFWKTHPAPDIDWDDVIARSRNGAPEDDAQSTDSGSTGAPNSAPRLKSVASSRTTSNSRQSASEQSYVNAEVVVVGAGIAGTATAYHLGKLLNTSSNSKTHLYKENSSSVVLLDRGFVGAEASGLSAGTIYDGGRGLFPELRRGTTAVIKKLEAEGFNCKYVQSGALTLALNAAEATSLRHQVENAGTNSEIEFLGSHEEIIAQEPSLAGGKACAAILTRKSGYVDAASCTHAFADAASANKVDVMIHEGAEVVSIAKLISDDGRYEIKTRNGLVLRCKKLVLCPGAWSAKVGQLLNIDIPVTPVKGQIWVTEETPPHFMNHVIFIEESHLAFQHEFREGSRSDLPKFTTHDFDGHQFVRHAYGRRLHDGRVMFGGDRIPCHDSDDHQRIYATDLAGARRNQEHVYEFCPKLKDYKVDGMWSGPSKFLFLYCLKSS